MSRTHDIDNDPEALFQFDSYESLIAVNHLEVSARNSLPSPSCTVDIHGQSSLYSSSPVLGPSQKLELSLSALMMDASISGVKGKGISQPVPINPRTISDSPDDLFSMSLGSASSSAPAYEQLPDLSLSPSSFDLQSLQTPSFLDHDLSEIAQISDEIVEGSLGKGKAREVPPTLPPLPIFTTDFNYQGSEWPSMDLASPVPGPSSYGSGFMSLAESESSSGAAPGHPSTSTAPEIPIALARMPSRRRSLSHISVRSNHSLPALTMSKTKFKAGVQKGPGNLARKLLFKKRDSAPSTPTSPSSGDNIVIDTELPGCVDLSQGNCFMPWSRDFKSRGASPLVSPVSDLDNVLSEAGPILPVYRSDGPFSAPHIRTKGRSYSSPLPLPASPLEVVPVTSFDIFTPIRVVIPNYFDEYLPRELRLHILAALVDLHDAEHQRDIRDEKLTALKAGLHRNKWVGRDRGVRELFKLSRVSKAWKDIVFDGQLWAKLDLRSFPNLPSSALLHLSEKGRGFIRQVDLAGHTDLSSATLSDITTHISTQLSLTGDLSHTHLTELNLRGCSSLSTQSLHHLLTHSPSLRKLCLRGLPAVTNTTCDIIAVYCPKLITLDLNRCLNLAGEGIRSLATAVLTRGDTLALKELRLCGLRRVTDEMMAALGKAAPHLEVLDLSYARGVHNSSVEAFVSCNEEDAAHCEVVWLTAREAGRDPNEWGRVCRRVTKLRHLSLSSCIFLTDYACSHLAHAVPKLEFLELAGIGAEMRDDGLVRLLETTPHIRKLDLEDACDITDDLLAALTPEPVLPSPPARQPVPPQPGHALEHLNISYAGNVTNDALLELIHRCPRLRVLEADNTRMSGPVVKEFVHVARQRAMANAHVVAVDCRGVGENTVRDLAAQTRPRRGWRAYEARKLAFFDARDGEEISVGQDECDAARVVLKTFYSWQTVDAVRAAREKKRKSSAKRTVTVSGGSDLGDTAGRARWWSPGGRRLSGATTPTAWDVSPDREGCIIV